MSFKFALSWIAENSTILDSVRPQNYDFWKSQFLDQKKKLKLKKNGDIFFSVILFKILRWFRIWTQKFISAYAFRRKSRFKNLRGRFQKIFIWLNPKSNFHSKYVHILMFALSWTLEFFMFEKSNFCNFVIWRNSGTAKFQSG